MGRRALALAAALALAGTLAFPSAAAPFLGGPSDTVDAQGEVELLPAADSEHATVGPDNELSLDLTPGGAGLNPGSVTDFGEVFYVRYTGDQHADVWVTADSAAVSFAVDGRPADSAARRVRVGPDEAAPVSVRVDTTATSDSDLDVEGLTVHSRVTDADREGEGRPDNPTADTVPDVVTDDTEVSIPAVQRRGTPDGGSAFTMLAPAAGDPLTLDTRLVIAGEGDRAASLAAVTVTPASSDAMTVDTERVETASVPSAAADELGAFRVEASAGVDTATFRLMVDDAFLADAGLDDAGDLSLYRRSGGEWSEVSLSAVGERGAGVFVEGSTDGFSTFVLAAERPAVAVTGASVSPEAVGVTESATVSATLRNDGGATGERTVPVTVDGAVIAERTVALSPGETATVTASVSPGSGEHAVSVAGVDAGTLVVAAGEGDGADSESADSDAGTASSGDPGAGVQSEPAGFDVETLTGAGVVVAVVVVAIGVLRRRYSGGP